MALLALWTSSAFANAVGASVAIYNVRSTIDPATIIGARRSGALCLPAGKLRWSGFSGYDERGAISIATALSSADVAARPFDPILDDTVDGARLRVTAEIVSLSADICQPQFGPIKVGKIGTKGSGSITVRWRVKDTAQNRLVFDKTLNASFTVEEKERSRELVVRAGLSANAAQIASDLSSLGVDKK